MVDLSVSYLGLKLKNPIVIGSCGLTTKIDYLKKFEQNGAAAVVLKSIFEEEIILKTEDKIEEAKNSEILYSEMSETLDNIDIHVKNEALNSYIELIQKAKDAINIPVIASINCQSDYGWTEFVSKIENAGADAIELNIFFNPNDAAHKNSTDKYVSILKQVKAKATIPIAIKLNSNFSDIGNTVYSLDDAGVDGLILFNRFYMPDFDIYNFKAVRTRKFSNEEEYGLPLHWIALTSQSVKCDLIASTGIHTGETIIKQLLAGANAIQLVSAMYEIGPEFLVTMLSTVTTWMEDNEFESIDEFRGKMSYTPGDKDSVFERIQYMKYFSRPNI